MHHRLLEVLVTPRDHQRLSLDGLANGVVEEGRLVADDGRHFPIRAAVPRMVSESAADQGGTQETFAAKWGSYREEQRKRLPPFQYSWFDERYGFGNEAGLARFLADGDWILDAGAGPGFHASRLARLASGHVVAMDISDSVTAAGREFGQAENLDFVQGDILDPPFGGEAFDVVIADQVIHHTPDAPRAFQTLARLLRPGGSLLVYVYQVKPLLRELADEHVRQLTTRMSLAECMEVSEQITELGRELSRVGAKVRLERGVPLLGIEPGEHDVQRLVYWHFFKCFWNEELGEPISNLVNFDWYHPPYASRHTESEVNDWCRAAGLEVAHLDVIPSGISVRAQRPA